MQVLLVPPPCCPPFLPLFHTSTPLLHSSPPSATAIILTFVKWLKRLPRPFFRSHHQKPSYNSRTVFRTAEGSQSPLFCFGSVVFVGLLCWVPFYPFFPGPVLLLDLLSSASSFPPFEQMNLIHLCVSFCPAHFVLVSPKHPSCSSNHPSALQLNPQLINLPPSGSRSLFSHLFLFTHISTLQHSPRIYLKTKTQNYV